MTNELDKNLDMYGRRIDYLRISVTDRCNLRCFYCMPTSGVEKMSHPQILNFEDIERIVTAAANLGVSKIRFTGGEPLVRKDFSKLVNTISRIPGIEDLSLTTNGVLLAQQGEQLLEAGINRVNISLDTLDNTKFSQITRGGTLAQVLKGKETARNLGLTPLKLNVVVIKGMNDDEIADFARLTMNEDIEVRFIEYMPMSDGENWKKSYLPITDIKEKCSQVGKLLPVETAKGNGPAKYYRLEHGVGKIGFISAVSEHFCGDCNRLRLTSDGKIKTCLFSDEELDLRVALKSNYDIERLLLKAILAKPSQHNLSTIHSEDMLTNDLNRKRGMSQIGG
ncbi:GTP 3',8-cyclase MoaA [Natranaerobius thermophilus]|uniref:GTP 3',8-cyclase n=1 Tax=Natranaerobius thermophilus (strain ATCC BAA-1301 / DSM 18059 / JW/NM-WN-LF) TaxID=457570 RepID=B2A243_NATTJ|nr:GTP 3',8-cyclase MoaA [Natranaerobius thermophilus]ACB84848.1 molybdenum cofactor biosynthesis protein A [Natranaerobius thermophilus JW/NM-WN-LF]